MIPSGTPGWRWRRRSTAEIAEACADVLDSLRTLQQADIRELMDHTGRTCSDLRLLVRRLRVDGKIRRVARVYSLVSDG